MEISLENLYLDLGALRVKIWINYQTRTFSRVFQWYNVSVSLFGPFYRQKWQICQPFHILQLVKSLPFIYLKPEKGSTFGGSLPVWAIFVAGNTPRVCNEIYQHLNSENCTQTGVTHKTNPSKHLKDVINNTANSQKEKRIDKLEEPWNGL